MTRRMAFTAAAGFLVAVPAAWVAANGLDADYRAEGALWVASGERQVADGAALGSEGALASHAWIELMRSYVVLDHVAVEEGLVIREEVSTPREAATDLNARLWTAMDVSGNTLRVGLSDADPERAEALLHAIMERHVEVASELKIRKLEETRAVLEAQLEVVEKELVEVEREVERFRVGGIQGPAGGELSAAEWKAEEGRVLRRLRSVENLYSEVRGRVEQARLAEMSAIPDVRILSAPMVRDRRVGTGGTLLGLVVFLGTMVLILFGVAFADRSGLFDTVTTDPT